MANINKNKLNKYDIITTTGESFELSFPFVESANPLIEDRNVFEVSNTGLVLKEFRKSADLTVDFDGLSITQGGTGLVPWDATTSPANPPEAGFKADARDAGKPSFTFNTEDNTGMYLKDVNDLAFSVGGVTRWAMNTTRLYPTTDLSLDIGSATQQVKDIYISRALTRDGTEAQPAFSFTGDLDTGITRSVRPTPTVDQINLVTDGAKRLTIDSTAITFSVALALIDGNAVFPSLTFASDLDTGLYHDFIFPDNEIIGFTTNGVRRVEMNKDALTVYTTILNGDGTVGAPSYSFISSPDSGTYLAGTNDFRFATSGVDRLQLTATNVIALSPILGPDGSAAAPSYSFQSDTNTGIYSGGGDNIRISTGGVDKLLISLNDIIARKPIRGDFGSAAIPAYGFESDPGTGIWRSNANELSIATAGTDKLIIGGPDDAIKARKNIWAPNGSPSEPSYGFEGDGSQNTGMYRVGENIIGFTTKALLAMTIDGSSATTSADTVVTILGDLNVQGITTTIDSVNLTITDNIILLNKDEAGSGVTAGVAGIEIERGPTTDNAGWFYNENKNWWGPTGPAGSLEPGTGVTQTIGNILEIDSRNVDPTTTDDHLFINASAIRMKGPGSASGGTAGAPAYSFDGDENMGMYRGAADELRFSTAGTDKLLIDITKIAARLPVQGNVGSAGIPSFSFETDTDTGMYSISGDILGLSTDGTERVRIDATALTITGRIRTSSGSEALPAYSFTGDLDTGIYRAGADDVRITSNSNDKVSINNDGVDIFDTTTVTNGGIVASDGAGPAGGDLGPGTVNAVGMFKDGTQLATVDEAIAFAIVFGS